jgi:hypothetical protein
MGEIVDWCTSVMNGKEWWKMRIKLEILDEVCLDCCDKLTINFNCEKCPVYKLRELAKRKKVKP